MLSNSSNSTEHFSPIERDMPQDLLIGYYIIISVNIFLGLQIISLDSFVIAFYGKKTETTSGLMYVVICVCDIFTGVGAILHSVIYIIIVTNYNWSCVSYLIIISYILTSFSFRASVFYNTMLAIVRSINIAEPFYRIKRKHLIGAVILYPILWAALVIHDVYHAASELDFCQQDSVDYMTWNYMAFPLTGHTIMYDLGESDTGYYILFIIPFVVPVVLTMVCVVYQCYTLLKPNPVRQTTANQRKVTKTIFQITILCFICNLAFIVAFLYFYNLDDIDTEDDVLQLVVYITSTMFPIINAGFNPVILICRGKTLQQFVKAKVVVLSNYWSTQKTSKSAGNVTSTSRLDVIQDNIQYNTTRTNFMKRKSSNIVYSIAMVAVILNRAADNTTPRNDVNLTTGKIRSTEKLEDAVTDITDETRN